MVETTLDVRRVRADDIDKMADEYLRKRMASGDDGVWLIDALGAQGYDAAAISRSIDRFGNLARHHGLKLIVAIIAAPLVRMGASVVSASLRAAKAGVSVTVIGSRDELHEAIARLY
jgi:hypothetical protein